LVSRQAFAALPVNLNAAVMKTNSGSMSRALRTSHLTRYVYRPLQNPVYNSIDAYA